MLHDSEETALVCISTNQTWLEACHIATVEQLQLEYTHAHTISFTVFLMRKVLTQCWETFCEAIIIVEVQFCGSLAKSLYHVHVRAHYTDATKTTAT